MIHATVIIQVAVYCDRYSLSYTKILNNFCCKLLNQILGSLRNLKCQYLQRTSIHKVSTYLPLSPSSDLHSACIRRQISECLKLQARKKLRHRQNLSIIILYFIITTLPHSLYIDPFHLPVKAGIWEEYCMRTQL